MGKDSVARKDAVLAGSLIRKIVVTYREAETGEDRTFTIEHEGEGQAVDGYVWSATLMKKLAYLEPDGSCEAVRTQTDKGWKRSDESGSRSTNSQVQAVEPTMQSEDATSQERTESTASQLSSTDSTSMETSAGNQGECVWLHDENCIWSAICPDVFG